MCAIMRVQECQAFTFGYEFAFGRWIMPKRRRAQRAVVPLEETFARLISSLRTKADMTQEQLAEKIDVSVRSVRDWEAGHVTRPQRGSLTKLRNALDLSDQEWESVQQALRREMQWRFAVESLHEELAGVHVLPVRNASFDDWADGRPTQWRCNTSTGWVRPIKVPGSLGSLALEIGGNAGNDAWTYCRTRETQTIPLPPNNRIKLSFKAKQIHAGRRPERKKYVEVWYHDGSGWKWGLSQDVVASRWTAYETEWWHLPSTAQLLSVGVVVHKDGAFHIDDLRLESLAD
jgi:transcriptional regulator with XRE-family HTH domain